MIEEKKINSVTWIDLENPTPEELRVLIDKYDIEVAVADELLSPTLRPRIDVHEKHLYLILHFPHLTDIKKIKHREIQEIDFVIGKDYIITAHYNSIDALDEFTKKFEVASILSKKTPEQLAGHIFFEILHHLYDSSLSFVEQMRNLLGDAEEMIFEGREREMVLELSRIHRAILAYKEAFSPHDEVLVSLQENANTFFDDELQENVNRIIGEYNKIHGAIESNREYLHELRDTNDSLLSTKQNEIMKTLTVVTFVMLPLSLVAGIFGMNSGNMPFIGRPDDFVIISIIMMIIVIAMLFFIKKKKWLK
jgi:magnesium transporter